MTERPIILHPHEVRALLAGTQTQLRRPKGLELFNENPGRWTVMRRLQKVEPLAAGGTTEFPGADDASWLALEDPAGIADSAFQPFTCPFGAPGDRLWVKETWQAVYCSWDYESGYCDDWGATDPDTVRRWAEGSTGRLNGHREPYGIAYAADETHSLDREERGFGWRPSTQMPRWASRLLLEVTDVRVERVSDIIDYDAVYEGADLSRVEYGNTAHTPRDAYRDLWDSIYGKKPHLSFDADPWTWVVGAKVVDGGAK